MATGNRIKAKEVKQISPLVDMSYTDLMQMALVGLGVGLLTSLVTLIMSKFVFEPLLCADANQACQRVGDYASFIALLIGAVAGLIALTKVNSYRPLLVVLLSTLSLWGYSVVFGDIAWYASWILAAILFGLTYALFGWLSRIKSFTLAIAATLLALILIRAML